MLRDIALGTSFQGNCYFFLLYGSHISVTSFENLKGSPDLVFGVVPVKHNIFCRPEYVLSLVFNHEIKRINLIPIVGTVFI